MNKCLFTKLKGSVSSVLPYFGTMTIHVSKSNEVTDITQCMSCTVGMKLKVLDGTNMLSFNSDFSNPVNEAVVNSSSLIYFLNGDYDVALEKYELKGLNTHPNGSYGTILNYAFNFDELKFSKNLNNFKAFSGSNTTGSLSTFNDKIHMYELCVYGKKTTGTLKDIGNLKEILNLVIDNTNVSGNIKDLSALTKLSKVNISNSLNIEGKLEDFCNGLVSNGKTSGTLSFTGNGIVTYNNTPFNSKKTITFSDGSYSVS